MVIDINCDMGESYGRFKIGNDADILPYISSCNIACGMHGGDPLTISNTIAMAADQGKKIGAHPSYPDLAGFGRRKMKIPHKELYSILIYQISALYTLVSRAGSRLTHVKVHGALYNEAAINEDIAHTIIDAVKYIDPELKVFTLPGSAVSRIGKLKNISIMHEAFADRSYTEDLKLQSREIAGAVIEDAKIAADRVFNIVVNKKIETVSGLVKPLEVDTICIHGDTANAVEIARSVYNKLKSHNITIA